MSRLILSAIIFSLLPAQDVSTTKYFDEQMLLEIARQEALMEADEEY